MALPPKTNAKSSNPERYSKHMTKYPLAPTTIVNKNGVTTTVHKRVDTSAGNSLLALPAPESPLQNANDLSLVEARVASALISVQYNEDYDHGVTDFNVLERRLARWEPSVIRAYDKVLNDHENSGYEELVTSVLHNDHDSKDAAYLLITAQEDKRSDSDWSGLEEGSFTYGRARSFYRGIASLSKEYAFDLPELPFEAEDQKPVEIFKALAIVTYAVFDSHQQGLVVVTTADGEGVALNNNELINLIIRRPEDAQRIGSIMVARNNPDADLIEAVLDAETPSLSDGII